MSVQRHKQDVEHLHRHQIGPATVQWNVYI